MKKRSWQGKDAFLCSSGTSIFWVCLLLVKWNNAIFLDEQTNLYFERHFHFNIFFFFDFVWLMINTNRLLNNSNIIIKIMVVITAIKIIIIVGLITINIKIIITISNMIITTTIIKIGTMFQELSKNAITS